jgi:hypothetical protein
MKLSSNWLIWPEARPAGPTNRPAVVGQLAAVPRGREGAADPAAADAAAVIPDAIPGPPGSDRPGAAGHGLRVGAPGGAPTQRGGPGGVAFLPRTTGIGSSVPRSLTSFRPAPTVLIPAREPDGHRKPEDGGGSR